MNLSYLRQRMIQTNHLQHNERFEERELRQRLQKRVDDIDWELARADVAPFVADKRNLDLWSKPFFHDILKHLRVVSD